MKRYFVILIIFTSRILFSQESKVVYNIKLSLTLEKIEERIKKSKRKLHKNTISALKSMVKNSTELESELIFNKFKSNYILKEGVGNEGVKGFSVLKGRAGGSKMYYTSLSDLINKERDCETLDKCFVITNDKPVWELTQETKKIGDYLCYKAIKKNSKSKTQKTIAWYTNKIPLGFGPKDYYGLPGLILELETSLVIFSAKKIILNSEKPIKIKEVKGKEITRKEFDVLLRKSFPEFYKYKDKK